MNAEDNVENEGESEAGGNDGVADFLGGDRRRLHAEHRDGVDLVVDAAGRVTGFLERGRA